MKTASGLVMIPVTPGTGASPKATDTVTVNYEGRLTDGTVFDSSVQHGGPATVPLNRVIKCWTEALQLAKVGGKSRLVCPADLAYGDQGWPPLIKPGATLVFEVELLGISKPSAQTAPQSEQASFWYYCNERQDLLPLRTGMPLGLGAGRPADDTTWAIGRLGPLVTSPFAVRQEAADETGIACDLDTRTGRDCRRAGTGARGGPRLEDQSRRP